MVLNLDRPTVVLGLDAVNFGRIARGEPIKVNLRDLDPDGPPTGLPDIDVLIGATDTDDWRTFMKKLGQ